jgi:hypothetical protein
MKHWKRFSFTEEFIARVDKATMSLGCLIIPDQLTPAYYWRVSMTHPVGTKHPDVLVWEKCRAFDGVRVLPAERTPVYETGGVILKQGVPNPAKYKYHMIKIRPLIWSMMEEVGVFQFFDQVKEQIYTDVPTSVYIKMPGVAGYTHTCTPFGGVIPVPYGAERVIQVRHEPDGSRNTIVWSKSYFDFKVYLAEIMAKRLNNGWTPSEALARNLAKFADDVMSVEDNFLVHVHQPELMERAERCAKKIRLKIGGAK